MNNKFRKCQEKDLHMLKTSLGTFCIGSNGLWNQKKSQNQSSPAKVILNMEKNNKAVIDLIENADFLFLKLVQLNISFCNLLKVPNVICKFKYLTDLKINNNSIDNLPKEIKNLKNLMSLNLSGNKLNDLPMAVKHLHQLTYLNISHNRFLEAPKVLFHGLRNVKILDMSFNEIITFKNCPECLSNIIELRLSNNALETLPKWIFNNLCELQILELNENPLNLHDKLIVNYYNSGIFKSLRVLNIENCNYTYEKLEFLSHFKNLEILYLGNGKELSIKKKGKNYLGSLEMDIFKHFRKIKTLNLENVQISILPKNCDYLKNIQILNLSNNMLSWLPESFCKLICLKVLNLSSNQLLFLPSDIHKLVNLQEIHLENNNLYHFPEGFSMLMNLEFIDLYNNKIEDIDKNIFLIKKIKGIDLGLNCINFNCMGLNSEINNIKEQYNHLKDSFRKYFNYLSIRVDVQMTENIWNCGEISYDLSPCSTKHSSGVCEDDLIFDSENSYPNVHLGNAENNVEWEEINSCKIEEDEMFDPNKENCFNSNLIKPSWNSIFHNNYCPANGHVQSIRKTYMKNFTLSSKNELFEEGQFDSD